MSFAIETHRSFVPVASEWGTNSPRGSERLRSCVLDGSRSGGVHSVAACWKSSPRGQTADLFAVLPLMRRSFSARSPNLARHSPVFGPVWAEEDATPALIRSLLRSRSSWARYLASRCGGSFRSQAARSLAESLNARVVVRPVLRSPYIELEGDWQSFEASLGKEFRRQTRKRARRLERGGGRGGGVHGGR